MPRDMTHFRLNFTRLPWSRDTSSDGWETLKHELKKFDMVASISLKAIRSLDNVWVLRKAHRDWNPYINWGYLFLICEQLTSLISSYT